MKKTTILVPVDFSKEADIGLNVAENLAQQIDAKIQILHVINESGPVGLQPGADMTARAEMVNKQRHFMAELIKKRKEQIDVLVKQVIKKGINAASTITFGKFKDGLGTFLNENKVDLIVMGTSGETALTEFFSGNHVAKAMRTADVPVLAVKENYLINRGGNMLILVELRNYPKEILENIQHFARLFNMRVHIAHVKQNKDVVYDEYFNHLRKFAEEHNFMDYTLHVIGKGEKTKKVRDFAELMDIDIVASISEGDSGLIRLFFGSDTEKFVNEIESPVLAVSE